MATVRAAGRVAVAPPEMRPYRFTVRQYQRLIDANVFTEHDRIELLEGTVVRKAIHTPPHAAAVAKINKRFVRKLPDDWLPRVQCAIGTRDSCPEPDIAVVRGPEETYFKRHPGPRDVALVVEVADTTLAYDRGRKARIYARARVPVYWVVNLIEGQIEDYTLPRAGRTPAYRVRDDFLPGGDVPLVLDGRTLARVPVRELLP